MRRRLAVTVALGVLALGVAVAFVHLRPSTPGKATSTVRAPARVLPGPSTPTPPPRGALSIRGRVVDAQGTPAAGIEVFATRAMPGESLSLLPCDTELAEVPLSSPDCQGEATEVLVELIEAGRGGAPVLARATTAADGTFQLDALPEGAVALWAMGAQGSTWKPDVATGTDGVELLLEEAVSLVGRVVDESGAPVASARMTLFDHEGSRYFEAHTGPDGRFTLGPLPDVSYGLVAFSPGLMPRYLPDLVMTALARDIVLHAPRRLTGQVLAADGAVAGAQVRVRGTSHVTTTDAQGRFSLEPLSPDEYAVTAEHAGQHGLTLVRVAEEQEAEATVYLGLLLFVEGTVRDEAGGPIADALVEAVSRKGDMTGRRGPPTTVTSADGRFRLGPLLPGQTTFFVDAEQYLGLQREQKDLSAATPPLDFVLARATSLDGVVTDTEGQPLAAVQLDAVLKRTERPAPEAEHAPEWTLDEGNTFFVDSDAEGHFRLKLDKPGRYVLTVSGGNYVPTRLEVDAPATGLRVALRSGATVRGSVVDARGEPLPEVDLRMHFGAGNTAQVLTAESNEHGHFFLEGLPPGTHTLEGTLKLAGAEHTASRTVEVQGPGTLEVSLRMDTGQSVSGLVVDEQGRPIPDAQVEAHVSHDDTWEYLGGPPARAKTGADGRFTVHHLPEGPCVLSVSKPGYARAAPDEGSRHDVKLATHTGARDVRLTLRYQGSVFGRVVHADGRPVASFYVQGTRVVKGEEGDFRLPLDEPGLQRLTLQAPGLAAAHREVEVALGQDVDLGEVRLEPGRRVRGRVVDAETSAPVAGAMVRLSPAEETAGTSPLDAQETTFDGTFESAPLEPRPLRLEVRREGYLPLLQRLGTGDERLELRLSTGARVEGTVRDREGRPVETTIRLSPLSREGGEPTPLDSLPVSDRLAILAGPRVRSLDGPSHRFTSTGGTFHARGLRPGEYALEAAGTTNAEGRLVRFLPQRVRIPASGTAALTVAERHGNATLTIVLELERPEEVRQLSTGLVADDVSPSGTYEDLLLRLRASAVPSVYDPASTFHRYEELPAGRYTVLVLAAAKGERYLAWSAQVDVPAEGAVTRELKVALRPVPGTR